MEENNQPPNLPPNMPGNTMRVVAQIHSEHDPTDEDTAIDEGEPGPTVQRKQSV